MAKSAQINSMSYRKFLKNFFLNHAIKIDLFCHYYSERVEIIAKLFHRPLSPKAAHRLNATKDCGEKGKIPCK